MAAATATTGSASSFPFTVAAIATPIQLFVGDTAARSIADDQPAKFAAMECIYKGGPDQTEYLGGICVDGQVKGGIGIPGLDSFLVGFSKNTNVTGLNQIPQERPAARPDDAAPLLRPDGGDRHRALPARRLVRDHLVAAAGTCRHTMVPARPRRSRGWRRWWRCECGWIVTEVGRQPWIVNGYMRTADAVTPAQGIWWVFGVTMALYAALAVIAIAVLRGLSRRWREGGGRRRPSPLRTSAEASGRGRSA